MMDDKSIHVKMLHALCLLQLLVQSIMLVSHHFRHGISCSISALLWRLGLLWREYDHFRGDLLLLIFVLQLIS